MSSQYSGTASSQGLEEKSPLSSDHENGANTSAMALAHPGTGFALTGLNTDRIAQGFANLKSFVCGQCCSPACSGNHDHDGYQQLPSAEGIGYASSKVYPSEKAASIPATNTYVPTSMTATQASTFACDDPTFVADYITSLQPPMTDQPASQESMVYPTAVSDPNYFSVQHQDRDMPAAHSPRAQPMVTNQVMSSEQLQSPYGSFAMPLSGQQALGRQVSHHAATTSEYGVVQTYPLRPVRNEDRQGGIHPPPASRLAVVLFQGEHRRPAARRGPFQDPRAREETAQTRRIGSCIRCRLQRIRCRPNPNTPDGPCETCTSLGSKTVRLPCLRRKITDVKLSKSGQVQGFEWTRRWQDCIVDNIANWASAEDRFIRVTEGYTRSTVELRVRQFVPQDGDRLDRSWVYKGEKKSVRIPAYAIVDLEAAQAAYADYINRGVAECFDAVVRPRGSLLWKTYVLAWQRSCDMSVPQEERELLWQTLQLWMTIRLTTRSVIIVGGETLGMPQDIMDETSPIHGCIPLPPVMGAQLDLILIHQIQAKFKRDALDALQKMTMSAKHRSWLTTYLVTFMLLHNSSLITEHDMGYARKHGIERRFAREKDVEEYNLGANVLLAYYHFCNRGVYPFSKNCKDQELRTLAGLDEPMVEFIRETRAFVEDHKKEWSDIRGRRAYEKDYFYVSQLYEEDWRPGALA